MELEAVTAEAGALSASLAKPSRWVRVLVSVAVAVLVTVLVVLVSRLKLAGGPSNWSDLVQGLEALVNDVIFIGIAIFFLLSIEPRQKRRRVLTALHTLRSLAHIVDMHQLTKDPERFLAEGPHTTSSPQRTMTPFELYRYLDYSTEMLAIVAKIAALYVQEFADPIALDAAGSVQTLAVDLSRAIGQKIMLLDRHAAA